MQVIYSCGNTGESSERKIPTETLSKGKRSASAQGQGQWGTQREPSPMRRADFFLPSPHRLCFFVCVLYSFCPFQGLLYLRESIFSCCFPGLQHDQPFINRIICLFYPRV